MSKMLCIKDFEEHAERTLNRQAWAFYSQGAEREFSMNDNLKSFTRYVVIPRMLRNTSTRDLSVSVLGEKLTIPIGIAPSSNQRLAHPEGEIAAARAAAEVGTVYTLSTVTNSSLEDVAGVRPPNSGSPLWMQIYMFKDRVATEDIVRGAEANGYKALVMTVDSPVLGLQLKLWRNGLDLPPHIKLPYIEKWLKELKDTESDNDHPYKTKCLEDSLTWKDVAWLKSITKLPIVLKGILSVEDALEAVKYGASAVWVSNHGGRQLDGVPSALDVLPKISRALEGSGCEVYADGGVRWGSDVLKLLALGARAVFIGRPALWGLSHSGQDGVRSVLEILKAELDRAMHLSGCRSISDIGPHLVEKRVFAKSLREFPATEMSKMLCIKDFEEHAEKTLNRQAWAFYSQGAEREFTTNDNPKSFTRYVVIPRMLRNTSTRDLSVSVLGEKLSIPIGIAPSAYQRLAHPEGEIAAARAAAEVGTVYTLSTVATSSLEDVAGGRPPNSGPPLWMQIYLFKNRVGTEEIVRGAEANGYKALVMTVDTPVVGLQLKLWRNGLDLPPHINAPYIEKSLKELNDTGSGSDHTYNTKVLEDSLTWKDVAWLKSITKLPIVLKGILSVEDALEAVKYGVSAVWVSNHGGRQMDGVPSALDVLPRISRALEGSGCEVYADGGVRWGSDVLKLLALGARAVFIGRPALWGLAHSGQDGVRSVLEILKAELDRAMHLSGCRSISDIGPHLVEKRVFAQI